MHDETEIQKGLQIEIVFFGKLKEFSNTDTEYWSACNDTEALRAEIFRRYPGMKGMPFLIAVNEELIHSNTKINPGDRVAVMPPYAGG